MRILIIVPYVPSLIRSRPYNLIRGLAKQGHELTLFTLWSSESERQQLEEVQKSCTFVHAEYLSKYRSLWNCVLALPSRMPLQAVYCWQPKLAKRLKEHLERQVDHPYDVVHVEHLRGANYGVFLRKHFPDLPVVWDSVDCISYLFAQAVKSSKSIFSQTILRMDLGRTRSYEGWLSRQFSHVVISSPIDRGRMLELRQEDSRVPISVLPNGVDWDYFSQPNGFRREPASLVFSGKMSYHANITMALFLVNEIMPLVWEKKPEVQLTIVGKDPPATIRQLDDHPNIKVTGLVADIRPYLKSATAAVVPLLYGAGSQFKVLEAMACGTPVIATQGAVSALQVRPGEQALIANTPQEFAIKILELIADPDLQRRIGQAGHEYAGMQHNWDAIASQLEEIYTVEKKGSPRDD